MLELIDINKLFENEETVYDKWIKFKNESVGE